MCARSTGIACLIVSQRASRADELYVAHVYHLPGSSIKPSCSMPSAYLFEVPTWYARSLSSTICVTSPSTERIT